MKLQTSSLTREPKEQGSSIDTLGRNVVLETVSGLVIPWKCLRF